MADDTPGRPDEPESMPGVPDPNDPELVPDLGPQGKVEFPEGWTLFSGKDGRVRRGLATRESRLSLAGASWIEQPDGSPSIFADNVIPRGALVFPGRIEYARALFALYQAVALVGRLPTAQCGAQLRRIGVCPAAEGRFVRPAAAPPITVVFARGRSGDTTLGLTAPFTWQSETGAIHFPTYFMPEGLSDSAVDLLIARARARNRILPLAGELEVPLLEPVHITGSDR